jgi:stage V sporulation protein SpoVS
MGTTTFSGPVKAGTVREGASANTGSVLMAQSAVIDIIGATNTTAVGIIPANSQIVDVILNVTTVSNDGGTATVQVGHAGDTDEYLPATNVKALATTRGTISTDGTDIGTSDQTVNAIYTAANGDGTTGAATVTILYIQNNNLA